MRTITCLLVSLLLCYQATIAGNRMPGDIQTPDSPGQKEQQKPSKPADAKDNAPKKDSADKAKADSANKAITKHLADSTHKADSLSRNLDSLSIVRDLAYQRAHAKDYLYGDKPWMSTVLAYLISLLLVAGLGFYLLLYTPLCRDASLDPLANELRPVQQRTFSYSRVQLFWWTIIIFWCFFSFYLRWGKLLAFTPTVILLLGGGLAVSVFGKLMDRSQSITKDTLVPVRHQDLQPSEGLLLDILSDESGISIHRFQTVLANLIFGIAFLRMFLQGVTNHVYPFADFEQWQLTLLGISAAGFMGLKANENGKDTLIERQKEAVAPITAPAAGKGDKQAAQDAEGTALANASPAAIKLKEELIEKGVIKPGT